MTTLRPILVAAAALTALGAQEQPPLRIVEQVEIVMAPVTVLDSRGKYVNGIQPHEFRVYDNKKEQQFRVDVTFQPISLVVLVQADGRSDAFLEKTRKISSLLEALVLGERGEAALIAFDHRIQLLQDFTSNGELLDTALKKIRPGSSSSRMVDAIVEATRMLSRRSKDHRRVILLISETTDRGSEARYREAVTGLELNNIIVYAVNVSRVVTALQQKPAIPRPDPIPPAARRMPGGSATPEEVNAQGRLYGSYIPVFTEIYTRVKGIFVANPQELFTKYTGGREHSFVSQQALESAVADVGEELHSQYLITYNPNNKSEGGFHEIKVDVLRYGLTVRTRPGYWMAAVPQ